MWLRLACEVGQLAAPMVCILNAISYWRCAWDLRVDASSASMPLSRLISSIDLPLRALADALGVADVMDGVALRLELDALELAGQKPARPLPRRDRLVRPSCPARSARRSPADSRVSAPEAVEQPRAHARPALDDRAGVHERVRRVVVDLLGVHRADRCRCRRRAAAVCGKRFEISWPDWPCFLNSANGPRASARVFCSCASCWPLVNDSGNGWPWSRFSSGLKSKVSNCDGPPAMQRWMMRLASRSATCGLPPNTPRHAPDAPLGARPGSSDVERERADARGPRGRGTCGARCSTRMRGEIVIHRQDRAATAVSRVIPA